VPEIAFTPSSLMPVLRTACREAGLACDGADLVRLGENAIWHLRSQSVIVRIARSVEHLKRVEKELCVAQWLSDAGIPTVRVLDHVRQPIVIDDHPVSFWRETDGDGPVPSAVDLAYLLKQFHALRYCPCRLPDFDPLQTAEARFAAATGVERRDREFLADLCAKLSEELTSLEFALPLGPIHGDAHVANLLPDRGQVVLLDFESSASGPREWDLLPTAIAVDRYGLSEDIYRTFVDVYGFDVREWAGYQLLRKVRELTMTTWLMQNVNENSDIAAEFNRRIDSLRNEDFKNAWNRF